MKKTKPEPDPEEKAPNTLREEVEDLLSGRSKSCPKSLKEIIDERARETGSDKQED